MKSSISNICQHAVDNCIRSVYPSCVLAGLGSSTPPCGYLRVREKVQLIFFFQVKRAYHIQFLIEFLPRPRNNPHEEEREEPVRDRLLVR